MKEIPQAEDNRRKTLKFTNMWKLSDTFLNNQQIKDEIRGISNISETNENGNIYTKTYGM